MQKESYTSKTVATWRCESEACRFLLPYLMAAMIPLFIASLSNLVSIFFN